MLAAVARFAGPRGGLPTMAAMIAAWTTEAANGDGAESERLRLAATMLALAASHIEPNMRARHAYEWAMDKRWVGLDPSGRARIAAALLAAGGKIAPPEELENLASWPQLHQAVAWGLAIRLCRRLGAGSRVSLLTSELRREDGRLVLWFHPSRAQLASDNVTSDLKALAQWLGLEAEIAVGEKMESAVV
jgi:exopolyphosphatase/guanosine-5'-triphosphate,3'-diphosphate pyrophosphatase